MEPVRSRSGRWRRALGVVGAIALLLVSSGCSSEAVGDGNAVVSELGRQISDLDFTEITCPPEPKLQQGYTFDCQAVSGNGAKTRIRVDQPNQAGEMKFSIGKDEVMDTQKAAQILSGRLSSPSRQRVPVSCGDKPRLAVDKGTTLVCRATMPTGESANYTIVANPIADDVELIIK